MFTGISIGVEDLSTFTYTSGLDTEVVVVDSMFNCRFLNLMTMHTIKMLIVRITAKSPISDAITGKSILPNTASPVGLLVAILNETLVMIEVAIIVTVFVVSVGVFTIVVT